MNSAAKKLTGVYNYFGSKYSQIFAGDVREISGNSMEKEENGSYLTEKMLYEKYGRLLRVRERAMTYNGRPAVMDSCLACRRGKPAAGSQSEG